MDAVSYANSAKQAQRIKKFINDPDSTSGIITQPSVIQTGETVTIPAGRTAVMANTQINGTITLDGTMFIPSGATTTDIDTKLSTKVDKVTSTDNAIVRFDGITGQVQNSGVIIDDSGNVGIGVAPSDWTIGKAIDIGNAGSLFGDGINYTWDCGIVQNGYQYTANGWKYRASQSAAMYRINGNQHEWKTAPLGTAGNPITWTNAMTLNYNNSLGVLGNVVSGYNGITFSGDNSTYIVSYGGNDTSYALLQGRSTSAGGSTVYEAKVNNVLKSAILDNGTFQSATNVYGSTSDIKLKENVVDATPKLDKLMQVQVKNFNYIGQEEKQIGVIAQEIEQIFPSVVFETKDTKQVEVTKERVVPAVEEVKDAEGNIIQEDKPESVEEYIETETQETGEVTKNVKYSVLYMMAIKALQELNAKVEAMQLEINELKGAI